MNSTEQTKPFDAYEVQPVVETDGKDCEAFVTVAEATDELARCQREGTPARLLWTVYGHTTGQGVEAIEDTETEEKAFAALFRIARIRGTSGTVVYPVA